MFTRAIRSASRASLLLGALSAMAAPVLAHHGAPGHDSSRVVVVRATITAFLWEAPHSQVRFDAAADDGVVRHWRVEAPPPNMLAQQGWHRRSLVPGDMVIMHFTRVLDGSPSGIMRKAILANGAVLWAYPPAAITPVPR